jgi:glycosyltransferase EpsF
MRRVLHLIHSLNRGGIEVWLMSLLRQSRRYNAWQMDFACKGGDFGEMADEGRRLGAHIYHCPLDLTHLSFYRSLKQILENGNYDLIHNHLQGYSGFPVWIAHSLQTPIITSFHNIHFDPQTSLTRIPLVSWFRSTYIRYSVAYALNHSHMITGCSRAVLNSLCNIHDCKHVKAKEVLYYGVGSSTGNGANPDLSLRTSLGWPEKAPIVLHVGRFHAQKNHKAVIEIFRKVVDILPNARLLLVGDGPLRSQTLTLAEKYALKEHVAWLGIRDDVRDLMAQSNVLLFPSRYEGFGLVAVEANSVGVPVVGSDILALQEAVVDGKTALLHNIDDLDGMVTSVIKILCDSKLASCMSLSAKEWVQSRYTLAATTESTLTLYDRVIGTGS